MLDAMRSRPLDAGVYLHQVNATIDAMATEPLDPRAYVHQADATLHEVDSRMVHEGSEDPVASRQDRAPSKAESSCETVEAEPETKPQVDARPQGLPPLAARGGRPKIYRMPGARLEKFARLIYRKKTFDRVFKPELADMQQEYLDALEVGDLRGATIAEVKGWVYFGLAVVTHVPVSLIRRIWSLGG